MASKAVLLSHFRANFSRKKFFSTSSIRRSGDDPALHGSAPYRLNVPPIDYGPRIMVRTVVQTIIWSWMFYHFWYYPEITFGHPLYTVPDPKLWTDEDLGIPPDDYDEVI